MKNKAMQAEVRDYMTKVLAAIESKSIREWASTKHNRPIVERLAWDAVNHGTHPMRFASYLVCVAIGA